MPTPMSRCCWRGPRAHRAAPQGLALFALPRRLKDGSRNAYRIVRLKDKLGTRSMASGEILLEGAVAYLVGDADRGLKQMMEQVNLSRLSHGVRAAAMMRRCVNEALVCARSRQAFGRTIIDYPLLRRQLLKIALPAEQALSMFLFAAGAMDRANAGSKEAETCLRILTPLLKFRACRDNIPVATGAMEVRGGNGYIEEWVQARLVRDAHVGVLWEGTSNINALDIITRAVGKSRAHRTLEMALKRLLDAATPIPPAFRDRLRGLRSTVRWHSPSGSPRRPSWRRMRARRRAASIMSPAAILMSWEAAQPGRDARRALYARLVLEHRLSARDPLAPADGDWQDKAADILLVGAAGRPRRDRRAAGELTSRRPCHGPANPSRFWIPLPVLTPLDCWPQDHWRTRCTPASMLISARCSPLSSWRARARP